MGLLSWLLGKPKADVNRTGNAGNWDLSENGNPVLITGSSRITVFQQDRGWKYFIADINDRKPPLFSDPYNSQEAAMDEALAYLRGAPPRHASISDNRTEARKKSGKHLFSIAKNWSKISTF